MTFKGSRVDPIISPSSCIQISASSLDQDGYGIITYECTIANASLAISTNYNFTSIGRIPGASVARGCVHALCMCARLTPLFGLLTGQVVSASDHFPAAVTAMAPKASIVAGPNQTTLLAYASTQAINYTVRSRAR